MTRSHICFEFSVAFARDYIGISWENRGCTHLTIPDIDNIVISSTCSSLSGHHFTPHANL